MDDLENIENLDLEAINSDIENTDSLIYPSNPRKEIPVPELKFEQFWANFNTVADVMKTKEWEEIYSNYYEFGELEQAIKINEDIDEMEAYSPQRQEEEIIKCTQSFDYFCVKYAKINHPIYGLINLLPYIYQKRVINCYGKHRFNILSKFRQGGLTTVSVMWALWRCLFKTGQRIMVVSKTDREAIAAGEVAKTAVERLPSWLKPETDKFNEHEKQFKTTGSVLWFYTVEAARGKSITILIIDEAAFIDDMHTHWRALFPVINTGGACEVISTVNGIGNWYEEMYHEALEGKNNFNIVDLDYWEHPLYNDPEWIADARANLGENGWKQEVERNFLSSSDTWLNDATLKEIKKQTDEKKPIKFSMSEWLNHGAQRINPWDQGALWIFQERQEGHEYIIAADAAEGVGETGDNSAFSVLDQTTLEQVAEFYSNSIPPHLLAVALNHMGYYYNNALIVVENANQGIAVLTILKDTLNYDNLYHEDNKQESVGLKTSKSRRPQFLQALQQRLINQTLIINSKRLAKELNTFIFNPRTKKPEARRGMHDDAIIAMAIAVFVRDNQNKGLPAGADAPEESLRIFQSPMYEKIKNEIFGESLEKFLEDENDFSEVNALDELEQMFPDDAKRYRRSHDSLLKEFGW